MLGGGEQRQLASAGALGRTLPRPNRLRFRASGYWTTCQAKTWMHCGKALPKSATSTVGPWHWRPICPQIGIVCLTLPINLKVDGHSFVGRCKELADANSQPGKIPVVVCGAQTVRMLWLCSDWVETLDQLWSAAARCDFERCGYFPRVDGRNPLEQAVHAAKPALGMRLNGW